MQLQLNMIREQIGLEEWDCKYIFLIEMHIYLTYLLSLLLLDFQYM